MPAARNAGPIPEAEDQQPDPARTEAPQREQLDWEQLKNAEFVSEIVPGNGDLRYEDDEEATEPPEEDDDNPYQESDEALPDDAEEKAIAERNRSQRYRMPRP